MGGHVGVALPAEFSVAVGAGRHTLAAVAARHASPHARPLPRVQAAPIAAQRDAIYTTHHDKNVH